MDTNKLDLVMTPDGVKQRVVTPDDEMPDSIVYQGVEYFRPVECRPRRYTNANRSLYEPYEKWGCGVCGNILSTSRPDDGQICSKCHAKVVYAK
ncbi:hypothetical protein AAY81_04895 [Denitrobacterium detoxificans]|uniref:Uncharacterized protein n=1 Tax=Denitrobacterium detoxificans TaxID=79604 RepID=A0A172RXW4_9ACTN|nr:hypothetical protein [Denitrobacterium detoxificans]ANE22570.1 hypothetical protein AAY81_04895 [Denitrobacterium detoxificans]SEP04111.1 hypothetical protein SAMN02910314_02002 [Denitrobacterium detoxificans]